MLGDPRCFRAAALNPLSFSPGIKFDLGWFIMRLTTWLLDSMSFLACSTALEKLLRDFKQHACSIQ
jgi:hypothetical protein